MRPRHAVAPDPSSQGRRPRHGRGVLETGIGVVLVLAPLLAAGCQGCKARSSPRDERPRLSHLTARPTEGTTVGGKSVRIDEAALVAKAKATLDRAGVFAGAQAEAGARPTVNVTLAVELLGEGEGPDPEIGVKVRIKIDVHPNDAETERYEEDSTAIGQAPMGNGTAGPGDAFQRLAERTTEDLLSAYAGRQKLWSADDGTVTKAAAADKGDLRLEAIRIIGARKLKDQLPTLIRLLSDEDEATRDTALGAVVAIGDRSAVRALADSRQMRDSYEMSKILDAVAALGGQEAKDYLSFVGETHDDPEIRSMAKTALERLGKRDVLGKPTK